MRCVMMRSESVGIETMILNFAGNFVCAMQVETFRELEGSSYATTMCIGNLRSAMQVDTEVFYSAKYRPGIIAG